MGFQKSRFLFNKSQNTTKVSVVEKLFPSIVVIIIVVVAAVTIIVVATPSTEVEAQQSISN